MCSPPGYGEIFPKQKLVWTGNPVRTDILESDSKRSTALEFFGLDVNKPVLLIIGGSLGARTLNESMVTGLEELIKKEIQVIWQTGKFYYEEMVSRTNELDLSGIRILAFLKEMDLAYAAADIVISRAGALSISELCLASKPTIFVPSPNVAEDHQTKNAEALVKETAAILVTDKDARSELISKAIELINDKDAQTNLSMNIKKLGKPNAASDIAHEILEMIK